LLIFKNKESKCGPLGPHFCVRENI